MWLIFGYKSSIGVHQLSTNCKIGKARKSEKAGRAGKSLAKVLKKKSTLCCEERIFHSAKTLADAELPYESSAVLDCLLNVLHKKMTTLVSQIRDIETGSEFRSDHICCSV